MNPRTERDEVDLIPLEHGELSHLIKVAPVGRVLNVTWGTGCLRVVDGNLWALEELKKLRCNGTGHQREETR